MMIAVFSDVTYRSSSNRHPSKLPPPYLALHHGRRHTHHQRRYRIRSARLESSAAVWMMSSCFWHVAQRNNAEDQDHISQVIKHRRSLSLTLRFSAKKFKFWLFLEATYQYMPLCRHNQKQYRTTWFQAFCHH